MNRFVFFLCFFNSFFAQESFAQTQNDSITEVKLKEVVVTGTKSSRILKNVPVETSLITTKEIEQSGAVTVSDAIRLVSGVNISGGAPFGSSRRFTGIIRGLPAHYSLVLVDGKRIKGEHIHTGVNLGVIPVEMIDRIEIVKGSSCALYGSDAIGGIINIITKKVPEKRVIDFGASYGSFNTQDYNLNFGQKFGKIGCFIAGKYTISDGFPLELNGKDYDDQWFKQANFLTKISYNINKNNVINFNGKYYTINYQRKNASDINDNQIDLILDWDTKLSEKSSLKTSLAYAEFNGERKDANNITSSADMMYHQQLSEKHELSAGIEGRHEYFTRAGVQPARKENIFSLYVQDEMDLFEKVKAAVSVRADFHPDIDPVISPNLSILYKLSEKTLLRGAIGRGFRAASLQDRYEDHFNHSSYYRDGNPDLKPEFSTSFNISCEHKLVNNLWVKASAFANNFSNMIVVLPTGEYETDGKPVHRRENIKTAKTRGIETEFKYNLKQLSIVFGYTFLDTKDNEGIVLSYNPKHQAIARIYYNFEQIKLSTMLSAEDVRKRYYNDGKKANSLDDYTLLNFNVTKQFGKHFRIFGTLGNLLDQKFTTYEEGSTFAAYGLTYTFGLKLRI